MICSKCRQRGAFNFRVFVPEDSKVLSVSRCSKCAREFAASLGGRVLSFDHKKGVWF